MTLFPFASSLKISFNKIEKSIFYLLVAAHLIPLVLLDFFVTHDGPAHTYNTVLIENLISGDSLSKKFFEFNSDPQPNWGYNAIMLAADRFFAPRVSERIIIGLIILILAFSFRALIKQINPENIFQSYFILPFLFSFHLYIGFYNFCIGAALFFLTLYYVVKKNKKPSIGYYSVVLLLSLLMVFSHVFSFMLFCICLIGILIAHKRSEKYSFVSKEFLNPALSYLVALLPSIFICLLFLFQKYDGEVKSWRDISELLRWLWECQPVITLTHDPEKIFGIVTSALIGLNIFIVCCTQLFNKKNKTKLSLGSFWLLMALITIVLYFILPDSIGVWGFISLRTLMFFFLFLPLWFAFRFFPAWWKYVQVIAMTLLISFRLYYQFGMSKTLDKDVRELFSMLGKIKPASVIFPLDFSENWMHNNISNYLGVNNNIVLDNYEAVFPHFPLRWKNETSPYPFIKYPPGKIGPCADIEKFEHTTGVRADYVLLWLYHQDTDSCNTELMRQLTKMYDRVGASQNGTAELFHRKPENRVIN